MFKGKKIFGIITARGGSKELPGKNIKDLCGKPLINWTIEASLNSQYIDKTIVTTDCLKIAEISKTAGACVPFLRPPELSGDSAKSVDAIYHAIDNTEEKFDIIVLLQPTSPLRTFKDVDNAIELLFEKQAKGVVSVCECDHPPIWSNTLPESHSMANFLKDEYKNIPRQQIPAYYNLNGAVYVAFSDYLKENDGFLAEKTFAYIMQKENSVDIDSSFDFKLAEAIIKERA